MNIYPTKLDRPDEGHLHIEWSDGVVMKYAVHTLRDHCPCATCREKRTQPAPLLPVLAVEETQPLAIRGMKPVGNYAYGIEFSDGHDTGIFSLEFLRSLGETVE